ncbi:MAG: glutaminase, partial [Gammaproteobacteria bacterium]|nr:glutaminase [Gammaproteobacteria bacterium]
MMSCKKFIIGKMLVAGFIVTGLFTQAHAIDVDAVVKAAYEKYKDLDEGANADYIPALAKVDSNLFGIVVITTDGKIYSAGD